MAVIVVIDAQTWFVRRWYSHRLLGRAATPDLTAHWLLAVPIAESERRLLLSEGYDALEELFEERDVAYYDLNRRPVV